MPVFSDNASLMNAIANDINILITEVSDDIIEVIQGNVEEFVYKAHTPRKYKRQEYQGGFIGSWTYKFNQGSRFEFDTTIFSDPDSMVYDYENFIHGGFINTNKRGVKGNYVPVDRRDKMDVIIQEGAGTGEYDFFIPSVSIDDNWWLRERDYWGPTIEELDILNAFENSVMRSFFKNGIDAIAI